MSDESSSDAAPVAATRQRSTLEKITVWGGIGILLILLGIEARAQQGYQQTMLALQAAFDDTEREFVTLEQAKTMMQFAPAESGPVIDQGNEVFEYSWVSVFKPGKYLITLRTVPKEEHRIVGFGTADSPEERIRLRIPVDQLIEEDPSMLEGMGSPEGEIGTEGARRQFQPPPDPLIAVLDADADGEVSAEELEQAATVLGQLDKDQSGTVTVDEILPEGFGRRRGGEEGSPGEPPQRPESEGEAGAESE